MPVVSKAQNRFFRWAEANPSAASRRGVSPKVAHEFVAATHGQNLKSLPDHVQRKAGGGPVDDPIASDAYMSGALPAIEGEAPDVWYDRGGDPHMGTGPSYRKGAYNLGAPDANFGKSSTVATDIPRGADVESEPRDLDAYWRAQQHNSRTDIPPSRGVPKAKTWNRMATGGAVSRSTYPCKFRW